MRRAGLLAALSLLAAGAPAEAAPGASVTAEPPQPGAGSAVHVDLHARGVRGLVVRLGRGFRFDGRAVAGRCRAAEAARTHSCPADSRIGAGQARLRLESGHTTTAGMSLYLAPRQVRGDLAGVVVIAETDTREGVAVGRVQRLDPDTFRTYGLQLTLDRVRRAFRLAPGQTGQLKRVTVQLGAHRTVRGRRHDLIANPGTCGVDGWPWQVLAIYPQGDRNHLYGSIACSPAPMP